MSTSEIRLALPAWIDDAIDPTQLHADDEARVALAIALARRNIEERTGGPFGAAIFDRDGRVVAVGVNVVVPRQCSVAHAEIMALSVAQLRLQRARLNDDGNRYVLATSAQPCAMCYGAAFWAGIDEILIGARAADVTELGGFDEGPLPADWIGELARRGIAVRCDILRDAARDVFALYSKSGGARY